MKWRAAHAGAGIAGGGEERRELAGRKRVQGTEATSKFDGGQAALAIEPAEKILGGPLPLLRVAFEAAGDEVAVGIATQSDARHHMVEA